MSHQTRLSIQTDYCVFAEEPDNPCLGHGYFVMEALGIYEGAVKAARAQITLLLEQPAERFRGRIILITRSPNAIRKGSRSHTSRKTRWVYLEKKICSPAKFPSYFYTGALLGKAVSGREMDVSPGLYFENVAH